MSRNTPPPIFLQRAGYRQRRIRDAAKLLPFLGMILWAIPLAWVHGDATTDVGTAGLIYVFVVWVVLIALTAFLGSRIRADGDQTDASGQGGDEAPR